MVEPVYISCGGRDDSRGVKARALDFFLTGIGYLIISIYLVSKIGVFDSFTYMTLLGLWAGWNLLFSVIMLAVAIIRTFLLGIAFDYSPSPIELIIKKRQIPLDQRQND